MYILKERARDVIFVLLHPARLLSRGVLQPMGLGASFGWYNIPLTGVTLRTVDLFNIISRYCVYHISISISISIFCYSPVRYGCGRRMSVTRFGHLSKTRGMNSIISDWNIRNIGNCFSWLYCEGVA